MTAPSSAPGSPSPGVDNSGRFDVEELKRRHPIEEVVARAGVELRRQGRFLVGRCPLHADGGRPNLHVFSSTASWWCFRCGIGGDVFRFLMLTQEVSFREAALRLQDAAPSTRQFPRRPSAPAPESHEQGLDAEQVGVLEAALRLYQEDLLAEPQAMAYLERRGLDRQTLVDCRVGYAAGDRLIPFLRWQRRGLDAALRVRLLTAAGSEWFAGRVVVPEVRGGRVVWLIGRLLDPDDGEERGPRYLGLRGRKPLLGLEAAGDSPTVVVVEGALDYLTLRMWGYPVVAMLGTHLRDDQVDELRRFQRQLLVLDNDDAGLEATLALQSRLGESAVPVALPEDVKDPSELAALPDGRERFAAALLEAAGNSTSAPSPVVLHVGASLHLD